MLGSSKLKCDTVNFINASYANSTWRKHNSAIASLNEFGAAKQCNIVWPLDLDTILAYVTWGLTEKKWAPATVKSYLSSIETVHKLKNLCVKNFDNFLISAVIKGAENLRFSNCVMKPHRLAMSIQILKLLGHEISSSDWSINSKCVCWSACCVAFFGSLRLGEMLSNSERNFDPSCILRWEDVKFIGTESILLHIRLPKSRAQEGEFVDIFEYPKAGLCPVKLLKNLLVQAKNSDSFKCSDPVFMFNSGLLLSMDKFNSTIRSLLSCHLGEESRLISAHSFRAGIPSIVAKFPDIASDQEVMGWGRWKSGNSHRRYTRLEYSRKRCIYGKILAAIQADHQ